MAKSKAVLALEARLAVAAQVYRDQKKKIADLEAQLAARGAAKVLPKAAPRFWDEFATRGDALAWAKENPGTGIRQRRVFTAAQA